jgi:hypothetical protein
MEAAMITNMQPEDDQADASAPRFVIIVGESADGGSACASSWVGSLVQQMLAVLTPARERSQPAAVAAADAGVGSGGRI